MTPFELIFETGSPVTLRKHPIHLDGLLSYILYKHTSCPTRALTLLPELLLYDQHHGIYHASALAFGVTPEQGITAQHRHYVGNMIHGKHLRDDRITPSRTQPDGTEHYRKIITAGGPEKSRLNKYNAWHAPYLVFHGVGDIQRIAPLVQFYCTRIGVNANSGSGTIRNRWINPIDQDYSLIDAHGQIARNLPLTWLQEQAEAGNQIPDYTRATQLPVKAPYWQDHEQYQTVEGVAVSKIRRIIMSSSYV